ncbi:Protein FAR1-RELATED SEQUENCE 6, partial [Mucuna pruriens]
MEETSLCCEQLRDGECIEVRKDEDDGALIEIDCQNGFSEGRKEFVAPAVGMEFESYDDAYSYYICYAKEVGFRVRVKNSWFKRNSREKYGAVLCCSSQGFKRIKDVNHLRKETRTGCPAMIRMRLVESQRWRVLEVMLEHNHVLGAKIHRSVKKMGNGTKRKSLPSSDADGQTVRLYRALVIDAGGNGNSNSSAREERTFLEFSNKLNLRKGDTQAIYNFLCRMQLTSPNFFYLMDFNDEGNLRNAFWVDARSRAACGYFGDVIYFDNTYLSNKFEIPLVTFVGINHHGQSVLLGCGLLASETTESYIWLFRTWVKCMSGCSPQTIITDRCKALQSAIVEVFPRSHHCFGLSLIMKKVPEKLGGLHNYDPIRKALVKAVYETLKVIEFEAAWGFMIQRFGVSDHEWLRSLYEDRVRWAPVYLKDTFFAGMSAARPGESITPFFDRYVHKQTPLKEFLDKYELALHKKHKEESFADIESRSSSPLLKTRCSFELQLSRLYTREMFMKFQLEVEEVYSCFGTTQLHVDGPIIIFLVKERVLIEGNRREIRDFEVLYSRTAGEVRCICSCFNFYGYLCRHALCVLNFNGVEEIPHKYILLRWKKDYKRLYVPDHSSGSADDTDRIQWSNQLFRSALQVVEEGILSLDHYNVALQSLEESLSKIDDDSPDSEQLLEVEDEGNELENECGQLFEIDGSEHDNGRDETIVVDSHSGESQGKDCPPPIVGMEFDTYDDAYNYYNTYAKEIGFAIRVKSSWTKRNSKEKRGAVLCCNCEGFKTAKEANSHRKETRTGCLAMIRLRLVESNRWRVDEVKLEHNHSFDPERAQNSKSHKRMDNRAKRKVEPTLDYEVRTIKLYRMPVVDASGYGSSNSTEGGTSNNINCSRRLKLKKGDSELISNYFCRIQLMNPNFFYVMDLNDDGQLRNVFWIDSRSRAAYSYFGDVVAFDSTCLSNNYEIPLVAFVGVNHHGKSVLLGCGLLADETFETYIWLYRAWLTCMTGRPPQTIITNQCKALQSAIAEVFPRAHHRICLSQVMQRILGCFVQFQEYEAFQMALTKVIYDSKTVDEFERAWDDLTQHFGIRNHEKLQTLHGEREHWAPVYSKDTFFAGISDYEKGESVVPFFKGHVHQQTSLKEFFEIYELVQQKKHKTEVLDDFESRDSSSLLKTRSYYELQLSKLYTNAVFRKFQDEVVMMSSCFTITQSQTSGSIVTYMVKESEGEEPVRDDRHFEVMYDKAGAEVRCICSCFNFKGYLCRHALYILNYNGVEEIPCQYILSRWRKDFKRLYVPHLSADNVDISNPVQCFDHLYKRAMQVVEEGMISQDHYMVSWQAFKESLNKIRLVAADKIE